MYLLANLAVCAVTASLLAKADVPVAFKGYDQARKLA